MSPKRGRAFKKDEGLTALNAPERLRRMRREKYRTILVEWGAEGDYVSWGVSKKKNSGNRYWQPWSNTKYIWFLSPVPGSELLGISWKMPFVIHYKLFSTIYANEMMGDGERNSFYSRVFITQFQVSLAPVHWISQARILEWAAISSSRGFPPTREQTFLSCVGRQILYHWATRGALPGS